MILLGLALLLLPCPAARAEEPAAVSGEAADTQDTDLARRMKDLLQNDPAAADSLARRILDSSLATQLSQGPGSGGADGRISALRDIQAWIFKNPADAAFLAVGFAKDDRTGTRDFESSLYRRVDRYFELNPSREKGLLGRLKRAGSESQIVVKNLDMDDDERRELLARMFEGGASDAHVRAKSPEGSPKGEPSRGVSYAGDAIYDRLSAANPTGYSPLVQQLQSELNATASPGAPRLIETGKLDYPTLRHPYYALAYDIERLEASYRSQLALARAKSLGLESRASSERYRDSTVQRELELKASGRVPPSFERRRKALDSAAKAVSQFDAAAAKTQDTKALTSKRLKTLSAERRDAARWIAVSALEEDVSRLELFKGFLTPPLVEAIRRAAPDGGSAELYLKRGAELEGKLDKAISRAADAVRLLEKSSSAQTLAEADLPMREARRLSRPLAADIALYVDAPGRLAAAGRGAVSGLQERLETWLLRFFPNIPYSRKIARMRRARQEALDAFLRIAQAGFL